MWYPAVKVVTHLMFVFVYFHLYFRVPLRLWGLGGFESRGGLVAYKILFMRSISLYLRVYLSGRSSVAESIYLFQLMILGGSG